MNNGEQFFNTSGGGYAISRSLRFNSSDSAYLSRTPASAGNRKTWTWAGWVKRSTLSSGGYKSLFGTGTTNSDSNNFNIQFLYDQIHVGLWSTSLRKTYAVFRDASAWYHIVIAFDSTEASEPNRFKLWINGVQITSFEWYTNVTQNADYGVNEAKAHYLGVSSGSGGQINYFDGLLADIHFCDGTAYDASAFGEFDANGIWQPKKFAGVYGSQGFHLDFSNNASAAALGTDTSGNGNTWSVNNLSVTAGAGNDSLVDVPTNGAQTDTGVGGEVRGNYFVANPLDNGGLALANGNLDLSTTSSSDLTARGTIGITSGKWYWEVTATNLVADPFNKISVVGIATANSVLPTYVGSNATSWGYVNHNGTKVTNASPSAYGNSWVTNDVIGIAFDADNGKLFFAKNNTWQGSGDPVAGTNAAFTGLTSGPYLPAFNLKNSGASVTINTGARPFAYTAPSGFKALCTANLPAPVVTKPSTVMDVVTWSGNNASPRTISGLNLSPDFVWIKSRSDAAGHALFDVVRGAGNVLRSMDTSAEVANPAFGYVSGFNSDGFALTAGTYPGFESGDTNMTGRTYVGWCWDAGSSTVTNTQGSITSQVRANASAGFSIVTYTGNATANASIGHGLNVAPPIVIIKNRSISSDWAVQTTLIDGSLDALFLNTTGAKIDSGSNLPTSSVFYVGSGDNGNGNGNSLVAYCFAPVAGYSSMGTYTGNGSADGSFVYTGFRSRWVMIKRTDTTGGWNIIDTARSAYNVVDTYLYANQSWQENYYGAATYFDILSNGIKFRSSTTAELNASGGTYIYFAVAESPFQYARAR